MGATSTAVIDPYHLQQQQQQLQQQHQQQKASNLINQTSMLLDETTSSSSTTYYGTPHHQLGISVLSGDEAASGPNPQQLINFSVSDDDRRTMD